MNEQPKLTPAEMYEQYWGPAIFQPWADILLEYAVPAAGEHVLDLACGTGIVARKIAPQVGSQGRVAAADINPVMLEAGKAQPAPGGAQIEWHLGNAVQLDFPDQSFDLVVCQQGMQFVQDRSAATREIWRVLKPGGRFVMAAWTSIDEHPLYKAQAETEARHLEPLGVDKAEVTAPWAMADSREVKRILEEAGFTRIEVFHHSRESVFSSIEGFVENSEYAYAAVIPQFVENPAAFREYVEAVKQDLQPVLSQHMVGNAVVIPMHAHISVAWAPRPA
jgi:ubiquinone/menaquinone biosynthesis C-methylase UbiE